VRNSAIPNHIYRWTERELLKTVRSGFPERQINLTVKPFFDLYATEEELALRTTTRFAGLSGSPRMLRLLRVLQNLCNLLPIVGGQGNHFFAGIEKGPLKPWIEEISGRLRLKQDFEAMRGKY
jgi:hypothetical protein